MKYHKFLDCCRETVPLINHQGAEYLEYHAVRFHRTYEHCHNLLQTSGRLLSVGAGSAYVEALLQRELNARVYAVDFQSAIDLNRRHYDARHFVSLAADLSLESLSLHIDPCDLVLSAEIVEHIPEPPSVHFRKLVPYLKQHGHLVVTTPNLGSIMHLLSLIRMTPIMPSPEKTFGPVNFENEGVHRREYMPSEIVDALDQCGLDHVVTEFTWYHRQQDLPTRWLQSAVPRLRPAMIIIGRKR